MKSVKRVRCSKDSSIVVSDNNGMLKVEIITRGGRMFCNLSDAQSETLIDNMNVVLDKIKNGGETIEDKNIEVSHSK